MTEQQAAAVTYAANTLGMRPLSCSQLLKKLIEKGHEESDALFALNKMEELGAVDDHQYAQIYAQDRAIRGFGPMRIKQELITRGVDRDIIGEVLEELPGSDVAIEAFIIQRTQGRMIDRREAKKITDALIRKGFSYNDVSGYISEFLEDN